MNGATVQKILSMQPILEEVVLHGILENCLKLGAYCLSLRVCVLAV